MPGLRAGSRRRVGVTMEKVGRAMSWSFIARVAASAVGFVANVFIIRALSEYEWGVYSEIKTILQFVLVFVMIGVDTAILKFVPLLRVEGGAGAFSRTFRRLVLLQMGVWGVIFLVSRFGGNLLGVFFRDSSGRFGFYLQLAVVCFVFELFMLLLNNFFQAWYETKRLAAVMIGGNALYLALVIVAMSKGLGIAAVLVSGAAMNLFMIVLLAPGARRLMRSARKAGTGPGVGAVLRFSLPFVVTGILGQIVWRQSEVLFLGHFKGAEAAGFFSFAYRMPQMLLEFVPLTVWPIVMAGTSELYARDEGNLPRAIDVYFRLIFLLVVPVAAMGFAFARPLIPIVYGAKMLPAALLTQLFFVVFSYSFLYTPMSMAFYVMGKSWVNMLIFMSLAIIEIALDFALIPAYGMWGAIGSVSIVLLLGVMAFHSVMRRVRPDVRMPAGFIARCSLAAVPTCLLSLVVSRWSSPAVLSLAIPVGIGLLVAGFRILKVIGPEEKELIRKLPIPARERLLAIF
jgi:O-antigen/teichoic acid export membrane protein